MDKIIRIDVSAPGGPVASAAPIGKYVGFGGRAITSAIIHDEVPPLSPPLGGQNKLVIAPGLLAGTSASTSCRLSIGCKSPLTNALNEANAAGQAARHLGRLNIAAIVIEGEPSTSSFYMITLSDKGVSIKTADHLQGLTNHNVCAELKKKHGSTPSIISIGLAGEHRMSSATIAVTDSNTRPTCHAQRGGVGAVMGAKGIKCIIIDPSFTAPREPADAPRFQNAHNKFIKGLHQHDFSGRQLPIEAEVLTWILNGAGGCPAFNARALGLLDHGIPSFQNQTTTEPPSCQLACSIKCTGEYLDKDGNYIFNAPSYESLWAFGQHCGITDTEAVSELNFLVEDYGFDCIEMGMAIRTAMDAGVIEFGDVEEAIHLVREAGKATPIGRIIGNGSETAARCLGIAPTLPSDSDNIPKYDKSSPSNTSNATTKKNSCRTDPQCRIDIRHNLEIATAALDSIGFCLFSVFAILDQPKTLDAMVEIINGMFNIKLTDCDIVGLGKQVLKLENNFNRHAGMAEKHHRLPPSFSREFLASHNMAFKAFNEDSH